MLNQCLASSHPFHTRIWLKTVRWVVAMVLFVARQSARGKLGRRSPSSARRPYRITRTGVRGKATPLPPAPTSRAMQKFLAFFTP